jgi:hypothetical protein
MGPENAPLNITTADRTEFQNFKRAAALYPCLIVPVWISVMQLNSGLVISYLLKPRMGLTLSQMNQLEAECNYFQGHNQTKLIKGYSGVDCYNNKSHSHILELLHHWIIKVVVVVAAAAAAAVVVVESHKLES